MRGRGLSQRLKNLNLENNMKLGKIEESEEIPGVQTSPRQIKSPTKFASPHSAFQPYDKITALGISTCILVFYKTFRYFSRKKMEIN